MDKLINLKFLYDNGNVVTDNFVSRLHYKYTVPLLIFFGALATSNELFGNRIECTSSSKSKVSQQFIDSYCWIHPTFTVLDEKQKPLSNFEETAQVGIINSSRKIKQYHNYYQWVSMVLFIQAFLIYFPRFLWMNSEKKLINNLHLGIEINQFDEEKRKIFSDNLVEFIVKRPKITNNLSYYYYMLIEILNLLNVVAQILMMNHFLNMNFQDYGLEILNFNKWSYDYYFDPMTKVFPKLTKCHYADYGSSGDTNKIDYLCILPFNIINEKIYLFLWFWYLLLVVTNLVNLIFRFLLSFSTEFRLALIMINVEIVNKTALSSIVFNCSIGEWFVLNVLSKNLDSLLFNDVVNGIYDKIKNISERNCNQSIPV